MWSIITYKDQCSNVTSICVLVSSFWVENKWRHDLQHNDIQLNDTQHKDTYKDIQLNDTLHNDPQLKGILLHHLA